MTAAIGGPGCFAQTYAEARAKFLAAVDAAGLDVHSHAHPLLGRDGEALAMDVACDGPAHSERLLIVSSACHGVEGFCGSGVQVALLGDEAFRATAHEAGVAVLHVHALNPWGFSWWRRTTHENCDLNRNFHDFSQPLPVNPGYEELAALIVPHDWPPSDAVRAGIERYVAAHGMAGLQAAISGGQHTHPQGLFYGGVNPTWSNVTLRHVLREDARHARRLGWIDLHTGLGPSGHGERIFAGRDDAAEIARARRWWGEGEITSTYDGSSTSAQLTGLMCFAAYEECPQAEFTSIALEYGTLPLMEVMDALRADQWLENHPETDDAARTAIKRRTRDAFYTDTDTWKAQVLAQAREAALQAVQGLGAA